MALVIHTSTATRNARLQALMNQLDADTNPGYIEFYTATQPATGGDAITTQTLLGTVTLSKPSGTITGGVLTFSTITADSSADDAGDIDWCRFYDGAGTWVMDGNCGLSASDALVRFQTVTTQVGGIIQILSGSLTEGGA